MKKTKEKGQMKRLFAIFLLMLVLFDRIGEKEIFATENVSIGTDDTENENGSIPDSESDGDDSIADNEPAGVSETEIGGKITIKVIHDFDGSGAEIVLQKGDIEVRRIRIGTASGTFEYDLDSAEYDSFYIKKADNTQVGNTTVRISTADLKEKKAVYGSWLAVRPGGWLSENNVRTVNYGVPIYIKHDFKDGASIRYVKNDADVGTPVDLPSDNIVLFDLESTEYDGFYIEEKGTTNIANKTEILDKEKITAALKDMENMPGGGICLRR